MLLSSRQVDNGVRIPTALIWAQCITFSLLYSVWMIYELLYFRRILLIGGAVMAIYPIFQCRSHLLKKSAIPFWFIVGLFLWALFHLFFFAHDYPAQLLELRRIWKYAGLGAIFALGLGISLSSASTKQRSAYWALIYFGLSLPVCIYLLKYILTMYGNVIGLSIPIFLKINFDNNSAFYIPKTDYVAFCLPVLALSLGQIFSVLNANIRLNVRQYLAISLYLLVISSTLFLFYVQNTKNGIAYSAVCIALFLVLILFRASSVKFWQKACILIAVVWASVAMLLPHLQKNDSWRTLIADTQIGFQLDEYPQWKYGGEQGFPNNEYGKTVSITNYMRAAWFKAGLQLAAADPLGYGLVEDSFKYMTKAKWPEASSILSHSHSGWLDLVLGLGFPGVFCILGAILIAIKERDVAGHPWDSMILWALVANLMLWITTEVAATVSFSILLFWIAWSCGLTLAGQYSRIRVK